MSFLTDSIGAKAFKMLSPGQKDAFVKRLISELKRSGKDLDEVRKEFPQYFKD